MPTTTTIPQSLVADFEGRVATLFGLGSTDAEARQLLLDEDHKLAMLDVRDGRESWTWPGRRWTR
jgi:hypothetical protein